MTKKASLRIEFSSIFNDPKWVVAATVTGFSSRREDDNMKLCEDIKALVDKYNAMG